MHEHLFVDVVRVDLVAAGKHGDQRRNAAHLLHLGQLVQHVVHVELVLHHPFGGLGGFLLVLQVLRLLDQGEHVAHAQNAAGHAGRMENLQIVQLFAGALELDGLTGNGLDAERRAATGITVGLGEDDAIHRHGLVEGLGHVHRVLTGHGVHHQQNLVHLNGFLDAAQLIHELLIHMQSAGGIQNHDVVAVVLCVGDGLLGDDLGLFGAHGEHRNTRLLAHHLQLIDGRRAVDIAGHQQRAMALFEEPFAQLGGVGGFTVTLQTAEHEHRGRLGFDVDAYGLVAAHELGEGFVYDLDDLLGGGQAFHNLLAHGPLGDPGDEVLGHLIVYVGLQQGGANLTHGSLDVRLGELTLAPQPFEHARKTFGKRFKGHVVVLSLCAYSLICPMISSILRAESSMRLFGV